MSRNWLLVLSWLIAYLVCFVIGHIYRCRCLRQLAYLETDALATLNRKRDARQQVYAREQIWRYAAALGCLLGVVASHVYWGKS